MVGLDRGAAGLIDPTRIRRGLGRHWMFAALLVLAAALRAVVLAAYHPALIFPDSVRYLQYAHNFTDGRWSVDALRQSGYSVLITPVMLRHDLWLIPLAQHLAGLATAGCVYAVLIRFGSRPWLAAVATVPVLFDPLQLILEQYVLADTWTIFLLAVALTVLVWRRDKPGWRRVAACGLLLGLAVTFRDEDLIMIVPAAAYLLVAVRPRRRLLARLGVLTGCFLIPVAGYLGWFDASHGQWNFTTFSGAFLYGRVADFASCAGLNLPGDERALCPAQPPALREADFYTWDPRSPQWTFTPPAGQSRDAVVRDFSLRILRHQPIAYAEAVGRDFWYGFSPVRGAGPERYSPAYLQFHPYIRPDPQAYASIGTLGYTAPALRPALAAFLTRYGRWCYLPGPVFAAGLVLALAALVIGRRRGPQKASRDACLLFTAGAVLVLVPPAAFATFDWRYQLPQLTLIPVAAILAVNVITSRLTPSPRRETSLPGAAGPGRGSASPGALLLFGPPLAVEADELVSLLRSQVFRLEPPREADHLAHLRQVLGAVRAAGQVRLEAPPGGPAQRAFQVARHQLDGLLADHVTAAEESHRAAARNSSSNNCLSRLRPRCNSTRWLPSDRASTAQTSSLLIPSTSRNNTTSRCRAGSSSIQTRMRSASLPASIRPSATSIQCSGGSAQPPEASNRDGSTAGSGSATGMLRCSRVPVFRAWFTRMANSQVLSDERPSNPPRPRNTASQVSWTTSSAMARLGTNEAASRSIGSWCRSTRPMNARSSPERNRSSSSPSDSITARIERAGRGPSPGRDRLIPSFR